MDDENLLSDLEAVMWRLEADPQLSSTFATLTVLDQSIDFDRLRSRMIRAMTVVPRLQRRIAGHGLGLNTLRWEIDPDLDIDFHLRHETLPEPGDMSTLLARSAAIAHTPFERNRPLWEFIVIDGLADGRGAMVHKMHHTITDGEGGVRMSMQFLDLERHPATSKEVLPPVRESVAPPTSPRGPENILGALADATRLPLDRIRQVIDSASELAQDRARLAELPGDVSATVTSLVRQLGLNSESLSPLWRSRGNERQLRLLTASLSDVKDASRRLGGSINDVFVAAAAGGAGAYHREHGEDVKELRMAMPVSTRTDRGEDGNQFVPTRLVVSTEKDPRARFDAIRERLSATKSEKALPMMQAVTGAGLLLPPPLLIRLVRQQTAAVDFTTSNLRGAPFPLFIAGAEIVGAHPLGPLAGTGWNLTTMSVNGNLDMGLHTDDAAIDDPDLLQRLIGESLEELIGL